MPVTETLQGLGEWSLTLSDKTPQELLDALQFFGHVAIHAGEVDPRLAGDALLADSRYVGVLRGRDQQESLTALRGVGMAFWLGDEDAKGHVIEEPLVLNDVFEDVIPLLLPPSVQPGTIFNVPETFSGTLQYLSPREALNYVCDTLECAWRINGDGSVDAGLESDLFVVVPQAALVRRDKAGQDMFLSAFAGRMGTEQDMNDFTTRTVLLANGSEGSTVTATADILPAKNPYLDLFGNPVALTRLISESDTDATNAPARAQLQLNRFTEPRNAITLNTNDYDLKGTVAVGDYLWAYDPEINVEDASNEIMFRGLRMYPMKLRLTEMTWAVVEGMGVAYRDILGGWHDLTPYVTFETGGESTLTVGGFNRSLTAGDGGQAGSRPIVDTSIPGVPTWITPFVQSVYQSARGESRTQVQLQWTRPMNVDGTTILDGDHFEIRYRSSSTPIYPSTHAQLAVRTHAELAAGTHRQPITYPAGPWQTMFVPWSELDALIIDLPTNLPYEAQIRAVDAAKPPNAGDWSAVTAWQTNADTLPPATPAPPVVAASRLAVMITHTLGRASGGTYNLDLDLHHFEVHGQYEPLFTPSDSTLLGKVLANAGMITSNLPVVGTVPVESVNPVYFKVIAVDNDGNKSLPSAAVQATALLVDDAHISSLTVSKITAGTITATWVMGGKIMSGLEGGARVQMVPTGFEAYNASNDQTVLIDTNGNVVIQGELRSNFGTGARVVLAPKTGSTYSPEIRWHPGNLAHDGFIYAQAASNILGSLGNGIFMSGAKFTSSSSIAEGGRLALASSGAIFGYQNSSYDAFLWFNDTGKIQMKGWFGGASQGGGRDALVAGASLNAGGSNVTYGVAYGQTMIGTMAPTYGVRAATNPRCWHMINGYDANGFSVTVSLANDWDGSKWVWGLTNDATNTISLFWAAYRVTA